MKNYWFQVASRKLHCVKKLFFAEFHGVTRLTFYLKLVIKNENTCV